MDFINSITKYVYHYLYYYRNHFIKYAVGSTVKYLRLPIFQKMIVFFPTFPEQQKIASFLSAIDTKISLTQKKVVLTKQYTKGLLQRMFI